MQVNTQLGTSATRSTFAGPQTTACPVPEFNRAIPSTVEQLMQTITGLEHSLEQLQARLSVVVAQKAETCEKSPVRPPASTELGERLHTCIDRVQRAVDTVCDLEKTVQL